MAKTAPRYQADGGEGRILKSYEQTLWTVKILLGQQIIAISFETKYIYDMNYVTVQ